MREYHASPVHQAKLLALVLVFVAGCKGDGPSAEPIPASASVPPVGCLAGESRLCYCENGQAGNQVCNADGRSLGPCTCANNVQPRAPAQLPTPASPRTPAPSHRPGPWALLIGSDSTFRSATHEFKMATRDLNRPVAIYRMGGNFRTVVGAYATEQDALDDQQSVVDSMLWRKSRRVAVPRHVTRWCGDAPPIAPLPEDPGFDVLYFDCEP